MKNQHFQIFTCSINSFQELIFVCFCSTFSSQNLWVFCRRDLSLSEPFLEWFLMVWAPIWLPKPSKRPSKRHPKKRLNFDTYFLLIFDNFGDPLEHPKSQKMVLMHECGGPILAPKAAWEGNGAPRWYFKAFWLPKLAFWGSFLCIFCIFLGSRSSTTSGIGVPTKHLPSRLSKHALATKLPNDVEVSKGSACQLGISIGYLPNKRPKHTLAKSASFWAVAAI